MADPRAPVPRARGDRESLRQEVSARPHRRRRVSADVEPRTSDHCGRLDVTDSLQVGNRRDVSYARRPARARPRLFRHRTVPRRAASRCGGGDRPTLRARERHLGAVLALGRRHPLKHVSSAPSRRASSGPRPRSGESDSTPRRLVRTRPFADSSVPRPSTRNRHRTPDWRADESALGARAVRFAVDAWTSSGRPAPERVVVHHGGVSPPVRTHARGGKVGAASGHAARGAATVSRKSGAGGFARRIDRCGSALRRDRSAGFARRTADHFGDAEVTAAVVVTAGAPRTNGDRAGSRCR